jgi:hypothetical protein
MDLVLQWLSLVKGRIPLLSISQYSIQSSATLDYTQATGVPPSIPYDQSYYIATDCASASDPEYQK